MQIKKNLKITSCICTECWKSDVCVPFGCEICRCNFSQVRKGLDLDYVNKKKIFEIEWMQWNKFSYMKEMKCFSTCERNMITNKDFIRRMLYLFDYISFSFSVQLKEVLHYFYQRKPSNN